MALLKDEMETPCAWGTELELGTRIRLVAGSILVVIDSISNHETAGEPSHLTDQISVDYHRTDGTTGSQIHREQSAESPSARHSPQAHPYVASVSPWQFFTTIAVP
jgi:hypothetical protein